MVLFELHSELLPGIVSHLTHALGSSQSAESIVQVAYTVDWMKGDSGAICITARKCALHVEVGTIARILTFGSHRQVTSACCSFILLIRPLCLCGLRSCITERVEIKVV